MVLITNKLISAINSPDPGESLAITSLSAVDGVAFILFVIFSDDDVTVQYTLQLTGISFNYVKIYKLN